DRLLRGAGLVKDLDLLSGVLERGHELSPRFEKIGQRLKARSPFRIQTFTTKNELGAWTSRIAEAYEEAFRDFHLYYPRSARERDLIREAMLRVADPRLVKLIVQDDKVVGFILAFPDFAPGLRRGHGGLWPFGWWHLRRARSSRDWCVISHVGLSREL